MLIAGDEHDPNRAGSGPAPEVDDASDGCSELEGVVRTIGRRARRANLARAAQLAAALSRAEAGELDPAGRDLAVELAHQLVGSAGTFGFEPASELAAELEDFFAAGEFDGPALAAARRQLEALSTQLRGEPTS